jgi:hypothetical protein
MIYYYLDFTDFHIVNEKQYGIIFESKVELDEYFKIRNIIPKKECIMEFNIELTNNTYFIFFEKSKKCIAKKLNFDIESLNCFDETVILHNGKLFINEDFTLFLYQNV